ncbi:MAG: hypothetical protein GF313_01355 [Caldithrix sp.]|nr:hypothetical protein [Caldithrix sp.]
MRYKIIELLVIILLSAGCQDNISDNDGPIETKDSLKVDQMGTAEWFEIATWNIQWFPKQDDATVHALQSLIKDLDIDLIAVQEISDSEAFYKLLEGLPEWHGILSPHTYANGDYQKVGLIYKTSNISINANDTHLLFAEDDYYFPRPPLLVYVTVIGESGSGFDFNLIIVHLKAFSDRESQNRRLHACITMEEFITTEIASGADPDFLVVGDWNDELNDPVEDNIFQVFLDKPRAYHFVTDTLTQRSSYIHPHYDGLIDHILITENTLEEYGQGMTNILYLDRQYEPYESLISDHRPVVSVFKGFKLKVD